MISHRLVGRERELLELSSAVEQAKGGSGGAMIVAGPPGIGKTRLATELTTNAHTQGAGVHWGRCWQGNVAPAFWPWVQVLRSMEADDGASQTRLTDALAIIGPGPRASAGQAATPADGFAVLDELASAISAVTRAAPTVVVIDDLQWADASSLQAFVHIATIATSCPLLLVATLRSTDEASRSELAELVRLAPRVELSSLSDNEVGELLTVALGEQPDELLLERVRGACGGNPFYIRAVAEAARHGDAHAFPANIRGVVLGQLAALDASTRSRIAVASVLGHEFTTAVLASIDDTDMATVLEAIAHAARAGLVRAISYGTRYAFVHDLVREAIYGDLTMMERAAIHLRAAAELADHEDDFAVAARAHHALAALPLGERADAVALATAAGDRARDRLAFDEAARWYRQAYDAASADTTMGPRARAELLLAEGSALRSMLSPRAEDVLAEAAAAVHAMSDTELLKRVVVTWTYRHGGANVFGAGLRQWVDEVLAAPSEQDMALEARVLGAGAIVACTVDPDRAWELLAAAKEMAASAAHDPASLDVAIAELHVFSVLAPPTRSWAKQARLIGEHVEGLARRCRDAGALADALSWRAEVALRLGDVPAADVVLTELEIAPFGPSVVGQTMASVHRGAIAGLRVDLSAMREATVVARRRAAAMDVTEEPLGFMDVARRYVLGRDGPADLEDALATTVSRVAAVPFISGGGFAQWVPVVGAMAATFAAEAGDVERARNLAPRDGAGPLRWGGAIGGAAAVFFSEVAAACSLPELAETTYRWLEPATGKLMYNGSLWTVFGSADHFLGRCASALGRLDDAERHLTTALAIERRVGAPHLQARSHLRLAELDVLRDDERARHLDACLALCDRYDLTFRRSCAEALVVPRGEQREHAVSGNRTPNRMVRDGDVWTVTFDARTVRLKDAKGMRLLARLLTEPGREIHALDLAGAPGLAGGDGCEPVLDAAAKDSYRRRLSELAEDADEARRDNDPEREARAEAEIDALTEQLAAAVGIGGRDRRAASQSERARVAATRNLRAVIQRAADVHPTLGRHLQMTIRTGTYCSYQPDPRVPVNWTVD